VQFLNPYSVNIERQVFGQAKFFSRLLQKCLNKIF